MNQQEIDQVCKDKVNVVWIDKDGQESDLIGKVVDPDYTTLTCIMTVQKEIRGYSYGEKICVRKDRVKVKNSTISP